MLTKSSKTLFSLQHSGMISCWGGQITLLLRSGGGRFRGRGNSAAVGTSLNVTVEGAETGEKMVKVFFFLKNIKKKKKKTILDNFFTIPPP